MGKYMAWFKMNTFHLHINEDSGLGGEYSSSFVVESKKYPALNTYNLEMSIKITTSLPSIVKSFHINISIM